jgi:hypothetical protein
MTPIVEVEMFVLNIIASPVTEVATAGSVYVPAIEPDTLTIPDIDVISVPDCVTGTTPIMEAPTVPETD